MDTLSKFFSALVAAVMAREASVGTAVLQGLSAIGLGWSNAQRGIAADVQDHFHGAYVTAKAGGADEINAIEQAVTSGYNTFCADEKAEFSKEASALLTLLESSAKAALAALTP
jgi:hypothetical protein